MKKSKVGSITMADGREYLHEEYKDMLLSYQKDLAETLEAERSFEVIEGLRAVNSNTVAKEEANRIKEGGAELQRFNYAIW